MGRIYGKRILLREYQEEDFRYIRKWVNDPEITDYLSDVFLYPHSLLTSENFLNDMMEGKNPKTKGFVIGDMQTGKYIGQIDIFNIDWKNRCAEIGLVIGNPENLNKGYGREAINLLLNFAFYRMNLHRMELEVYDYNIRGYRCYRSCGFLEEGRQRKKFFYQGEYRDKIQMGILKEEFMAAQEKKKEEQQTKM